jgi:hypothetical protein
MLNIFYAWAVLTAGIKSDTDQSTTNSCSIEESSLHSKNFSTISYLKNGFPTLIDASVANRRVNVIFPNLQPIVENQAPGVTSSYSLTPQRNGFDISVTFINPTTVAKPLGKLTIGGIRLQSDIEYYDFRHDATPKKIKAYSPDEFGEPRRFVGVEYTYPSYLYSPVMVVRDRNYTIGVSLTYPILNYKHDVRTLLEVPGGQYIQSGLNWSVGFYLLGNIEPGEVRTYKLHIRIASGKENFLYTLVPYRNDFRATYGSVQYTRDDRPVAGTYLADTLIVTPTNPFGYTGPTEFRPDLMGWQRRVNQILSLRDQGGYRGTMLWTPTGVFLNNLQNNYPFQFMSQMRNVLPMSLSMNEFRRIPSDFQLGFWWGHSMTVMNDWDTPTAEPLNPNNVNHVLRGLNELGIALSLGAKLIGLDAFVSDGREDYRYNWLKTLIHTAPGVKFVVEGTSSDIIHTLSPTWVDNANMHSSPALADFLVPGHEFWSGIWFINLGTAAGAGNGASDASEVTLEQKYTEMRRNSSLGYVPVNFEGLPLTEPFRAERSWMKTVPVELRDPCLTAPYLTSSDTVPGQ